MKNIYLLAIILIISNICLGQEEPVLMSVEVVEVEDYSDNVELPAPDLSLRTTPTHKYKNDTLWFSYDWNVIKSKKLAHYYRTIPKKNGDLFYINDYYLDGTPQMKGAFIDYDGNVQHGEIEYYRPNKTLEYKVYYANGELLKGREFDNNLDLIKSTKSYINFNLPESIKKKKIEETSSDFSFKDLFDVEKQMRSELNIEESVYLTKEEGNKIITKERKTGKVMSTLLVGDNKIKSGFLKLYSGSQLIAEIKPVSGTNEFEFITYHDNGKVFFVENLEKGAAKYFSPKGVLIAKNDGKTGSFLIGLDKKSILRFTYLKPVDDDKSFIIGHMEDGEIIYTNQYYRYNLPYKIYEQESGYTREYKEDGTIISEYVNPDKENRSLFMNENKLTKGYRSTLYTSKRLKDKTYFEPNSKIVEHYRDDETQSLESKEFFKKEEGDSFYFSPYQVILYNEKGIKIFEEKIENQADYLSVNYDDKGKIIGEFKRENRYSKFALNRYPTKGENQDGFILRSYESSTYEMFKSPTYEDINVDVTFELLYEEGSKKRELLSINDVVFIDLNWNGNSSFYNPIDGKHVSCTFKQGLPYSGQVVNYSVSYNSLELESIANYNNGELIYIAEFKDEFLKGTYYDSVIENINQQEIITTYFGGKTYTFNKTLKDGMYLGMSWDIKDILNDEYTYYKLNSDLSIAEFSKGKLISIENYQSKYFDEQGKTTPNREYLLLVNKLFYNNGKLIKLESYYNPEGEFKDLRNKLILEFENELPQHGEIIFSGYENEYYRVENGSVIQKLKTDYSAFYEITLDRIVLKYLGVSDESNYNDYFQRIIFSKDDYSYEYVAIDSEKKEHIAKFDGIKLKKGVFYFEKSFEGIHTIINENNIVYLVDKYIAPSAFNSSLAIKQIPASSSDEEFEAFYDFSGYYNPIEIDTNTYGNLELTFEKY